MDGLICRLARLQFQSQLALMHFGILTKYYQAADSIKTINKAEIQRRRIVGKYPVVRDNTILFMSSKFPNENNNIFIYSDMGFRSYNFRYLFWFILQRKYVWAWYMFRLCSSLALFSIEDILSTHNHFLKAFYRFALQM